MDENNALKPLASHSHEELDETVRKTISLRVEDLGLPARHVNALKGVGIEFVGDLVQKNEQDLLSLPKVGRKTVSYIRSRLQAIDVDLGMVLIVGDPKAAESE